MIDPVLVAAAVGALLLASKRKKDVQGGAPTGTTAPSGPSDQYSPVDLPAEIPTTTADPYGSPYSDPYPPARPPSDTLPQVTGAPMVPPPPPIAPPSPGSTLAAAHGTAPAPALDPAYYPPAVVTRMQVAADAGSTARKIGGV